MLHDQVDAFDATVRQAYRLRPLIEVLDNAGVAFDMSQFQSATVTEPEPGDPYPFVDRTMQLFGESASIRVVDCNPLVPPVYVKRMLKNALGTGMQGEFVVTENIALTNMEQFGDLQRRVAESDEAGGRCLVHDDIPFGLALYDDYLDLRVYDDQTGTPTLYVDTADPDAIEWGESVYQQFRDSAVPASTLPDFPNWAPDSGIDAGDR